MGKTMASMVAVALMTSPALAQDDAADLAKKLANPVAALISVPIQANYDENIGADEEGAVWRINIQPVIPFSLNDDMNLISRTILPIIDQSDITTNGVDESGIGDIVQSFFFSPKEPTASGWILGAGPVLLLPTGSEDALSAEQWGIGPTALALKQVGPWTVGGLMNHIWSVTGDDDRADVNATYLDAFRGGEPSDHFTVGGGYSTGRHAFQLAGDISDISTRVVGSYLFRWTSPKPVVGTLGEKATP